MRVTAIRDMTERKRQEEALKSHSEFQRLITTLSTRFINLPPDQIDQAICEALKEIAEFVAAIARALASCFFCCICLSSFTFIPLQIINVIIS